MAEFLRDKRFSRTNQVDAVLKAFRKAIGTTDATPPESLDRIASSTHLPVPPGWNEGLRPSIWALDTEFVNLPKSDGCCGLSASLINVITGETIVNHRLELSTSPEELFERIVELGAPREQFMLHYRRPCNLPIISPRELADLLRSAGVSERDYILTWATGWIDYDIVRDFLARENRDTDLLPPREKRTIRVMFAWKALLHKKQPVGLEYLFKLVFPDSELNTVGHHVAELDAKKLAMMAWKLCELKYQPYQSRLNFRRVMIDLTL